MRLRLRSRHRLQEPESEVDRASDEEVVAMFLACRSAGDRLTLLLPARVGLRPGQVAGLHRCDAYLMPDSRSLGCDVEGAHVHVVRRQNENGAWSKSKKAWAMPVDFLVVQAFDLYAVERHEWLGSGGSDHCLVNLFRPPYGAPITTGAIGELPESLSRRAGLGRIVTPRMCRHAMASNVTDAGGSLDEVQVLLGQKHPGSPRPYLHPATARLRAAVDQGGTVSGFRESVLCRVCDRDDSAAAPLIALCEEDGSFPADKLDVFGPLAEVWVEDRGNTAVDEGLLNEQERLWRNGEL
ncbi:DUF6300 family protein [Streptomyces sp. NPDC051643]|uniref:DUF6300 family protein n=1 Tax=Streptomyces sp. NPDC051643 TaxID=3365665 RepID=UPI0037B593C2